MYSRDKLFREQNYKSRKSERIPPSFSSTLLDEIYRSIDGNAERSDDFEGVKEKSSRRQGGSSGGGGGGGYEDIASFRRTSLVEKWMEKEAYEKSVAKKRQQLLQDSDSKQQFHDNDLTFFSSTSSSSDSSGALSSSDTEFFASTTAVRSRPKVPCFTAGRPKPVRTGHNKDGCVKNDDDDRRKCDGSRGVDDYLIKSKSRALKIYAHLKKVKQPISPGGRLTTFINSLFSNASGKKSRNPDIKSPASVREELLLPSTCSSASSFSRSCLSKYSPQSREKMRSGPRRTVRFEPVSVIVDGDLQPCGHKSIYEGHSGRFGRRPPLPPPSGLAELKLKKKVERVVVHDRSVVKGSSKKRNVVFFNEIVKEDDDDDDDCSSDSSSDLFELDHLAMFGSDRYSEELPVYETTHVNTNRAIASGLIR